MPRQKPADHHEAILSIPIVFRVGQHALSIAFVQEGRWTVSVDGGPASRTYTSQVEAWEAGVRTADEQDRASRP